MHVPTTQQRGTKPSSTSTMTAKNVSKRAIAYETYSIYYEIKSPEDRDQIQ